MICLFNNKATKEQLITTNGDYILDNICTKSIVSEKINEDFSCQFTFELDKEYPKEINAIVEDAILRVEDEEGDEYFRIVNVIKNTKTIDVFTVHITIRDIINMWCEDVRPTAQSGQGALTWIFANAKGGHNFNVTSNIVNSNTAYYESMSVYNALYGADNCFINKWGGETRRRGFNIAINDKIGSDRGMQIRSCKNIEGFESKTNLDQLCTVLYVKGFDGIKLDTPVISPLLNNYSKPYYKEIKFDDIKVKNANNPNEGYNTLAEAQAEMLRRGQEQFSKYNIDVIKATYNINFVQLEKTEEYKAYSMIETAFLGDTVEVIEDNYNVNIKVRVIERKYNVLKKERIETVLSNLDLKSKPVKVEDILKQIEKSKNVEGSADLSTYIDAMLKSGIKDSYVISKQNETLYMDTKDINTATTVLRINKNGIGSSKNGYWGNYEYGMTIDGKINASMISVGILTAIMIQNADGSLQIDLSGSGGIQFKSNGNKAIEIEKQIIKFYDWEGTNRQSSVGMIYSSRSGIIPGFALSHMEDSIFNIVYFDKTLNQYKSYIEFDFYNLLNGVSPITFQKLTDFVEGIVVNSIRNYSGTNTVISGLINGNTPVWTMNNALWVDKDLYVNGEINLIKTTRIKDTADSTNFLFATSGKWVANKDFSVNGNFAVVGSKNCIQSTENYGKRLYYATEDCESLLTDTGKGQTKEFTNSEGVKTIESVIFLDNIYKQSVISTDYYIQLTKYSKGDLWIKEQTEDYFIIESETPMKFNWKVEANRKGFENIRLEEYFNIEVEEFKNETNIN